MRVSRSWMLLIFTLSAVSIGCSRSASNSASEPVATPDAGNRITYCQAESFADCTQAENCAPGDSGIAVCSCVSADSDSVTTGGCQPAAAGKLQSRYPGVPQMAVCTSATNEWADCLGVACDVDENGTPQCYCKVATSAPLSSEQYVIVGAGWDAAGQVCASDVRNSSATPGQVFDATSVLRRGRSRTADETVTSDPTISWVYTP